MAAMSADDMLKRMGRLHKPSKCRHARMRFVDGGQCLECRECGQRYGKLWREASWLLPDWTGRFDMFMDSDERVDPFALTDRKAPKKSK